MPWPDDTHCVWCTGVVFLIKLCMHIIVTINVDANFSSPLILPPISYRPTAIINFYGQHWQTRTISQTFLTVFLSTGARRLFTHVSRRARGKFHPYTWIFRLPIANSVPSSQAYIIDDVSMVILLSNRMGWVDVPWIRAAGWDWPGVL